MLETITPPNGRHVPSGTATRYSSGWLEHALWRVSRTQIVVVWVSINPPQYHAQIVKWPGSGVPDLDEIYNARQREGRTIYYGCTLAEALLPALATITPSDTHEVTP
jgi:hypothetical protein